MVIIFCSAVQRKLLLLFLYVPFFAPPIRLFPPPPLPPPQPPEQPHAHEAPLELTWSLSDRPSPSLSLPLSVVRVRGGLSTFLPFLNGRWGNIWPTTHASRCWCPHVPLHLAHRVISNGALSLSIYYRDRHRQLREFV